MKTNLITRIAARIAAFLTGACITLLMLNGISLLAEVEYALADQQTAQSSRTAA